MKIAAVIPCYKVKKHVLTVIQKMPQIVQEIYVIDDCCPEKTGQFVQENCNDSRVKIIFHSQNKGVGGAVISGYKAAYQNGCDISVKIDGDGQMNPDLIPFFIAPIINNQADYTKGNRFYNVEDVKKMPFIRLFGNAVLSFFTKFSSGYYKIFDPTNGYTAFNLKFLSEINTDKIAERYFFESDILMRLNLVRARVQDVPMKAIYEDEVSNLKIKNIIFPFLKGHLKNFVKRIIYQYYLRDFSIASVEFILGIVLLSFGILFGLIKWVLLLNQSSYASSGTVMLAALPIILGTQFILAFFNYDIQNEPN